MIVTKVTAATNQARWIRPRFPRDGARTRRGRGRRGLGRRTAVGASVVGHGPRRLSGSRHRASGLRPSERVARRTAFVRIGPWPPAAHGALSRLPPAPRRRPRPGRAAPLRAGHPAPHLRPPQGRRGAARCTRSSPARSGRRARSRRTPTSPSSSRTARRPWPPPTRSIVPASYELGPVYEEGVLTAELAAALAHIRPGTRLVSICTGVLRPGRRRLPRRPPGDHALVPTPSTSSGSSRRSGSTRTSSSSTTATS